MMAATRSAVAAGLITHQIFRRYETYSLLVHAALLFGPPTLVAAGTAFPFPFTLLLRCIATHLATLTISILVYRLSPLHPLWRYPGPFWCRTSKLWQACVTVSSGKQHKYMQSLHQQYGDVVRIGPNDLCIRDASLVPHLMGVSGVSKGSNLHGAMLTATNPPMVGIQDYQLHMARRRPWTRGLNPSALKEYESLMEKRTKQLARFLEMQDGVVVLGQIFNYFSYDVMCDMAFGGGSELMAEGDPDNVWRVLNDGNRAAAFFHHVDWLGVALGHIPAVVKPLQAFLMHGKKLAVERMKRGSESRDLFHYLNDEDIPDRSAPPLQQLVDDGILAIVAGSDTTSSCLTSLFFLLLSYPETYMSLQAEVDRYYPAGEDATDNQHHREMTYLQAIINETLRLFPPVMTSSPRKVPSHAPGVHVGSLYLPPGTSFFIPPYTLQRDPRNFTFPNAFWPERWLIASGVLTLDAAPLPLPAGASSIRNTPDPVTPLVDFVHNDVAFLAFSHGPMNCVGKGFAMQEMRTVVCALLQQFDFKFEEGWEPREYEAGYEDYFVSNRPYLPVRLARRV